ncbi:hypothetical protein INT48_009093 [Thamnidium elegans]|uniref:Uncharacterized protein n=1 Tax=Thamnidium elegans TaxID=101142 RepID=A0A8H7VU95_9FUNG|nr:hypothetical protein INT48_009093 [Thamnidium elegans]
MAIQPRDAFSSLAIGLSGLCNLILALIPDSVNPTLNFKLLPLPSLMKEQDWTAMRKLSIHTTTVSRRMVRAAAIEVNNTNVANVEEYLDGNVLQGAVTLSNYLRIFQSEGMTQRLADSTVYYYALDIWNVKTNTADVLVRRDILELDINHLKTRELLRNAFVRPISRTNSRSAKPVDIPHTIYFDKYMAYNKRLGYSITNVGVHAEIANLVNDPPSQERLEINMQYDMAVEEEIGELEDELEEAFEGFKRHPAGLHAVVCFRSEHFWVYIFDYEGGEWWMYNDTQVRIVAEDEVFDLSADYACNLFYINRQVRNDYR